MSQPEHLAKMHNPEVAARRGRSKSEWYKTPAAAKELERIRNLNPMSSMETREKVSRTLKAMKHKPSERGGNGNGLTVPQQILKDALSLNWTAEYALSLGKRQAGYPTCYKLDLACPQLKIAIEVDGASHHSRKEQDKKKDAKLASLGWTVLRFWNKDILSWKNTGMKPESYISMILAQHNIHHFPLMEY
ncbi:MAG: endonuclease domain-containing protein [Thiobacillus sp.]